MHRPIPRLAAAVLVSCAAFAFVACKPQGGGGSAGGNGAELKTDEEKTLYALGLALARNLEVFRLSEAEMETVQRGLADGALGREPKVKLEEQAPKLQEFAMARQKGAASEEEKESEAFLAAAAAEPGAVKLDSGLIYKEVEAGTGESPAPADTVKVHYHGTLRDGTVFDSSVERGQPAQFPLNRVIPCWTEGVQRMKVGGKARLVCPSAIAYGDRGAPPKIKPGAALAFDVELLEVTKAPADAAGELPPGHPGVSPSAGAAKPAPKAAAADAKKK